MGGGRDRGAPEMPSHESATASAYHITIVEARLGN